MGLGRVGPNGQVAQSNIAKSKIFFFNLGPQILGFSGGPKAWAEFASAQGRLCKEVIEKTMNRDKDSSYPTDLSITVFFQAKVQVALTTVSDGRVRCKVNFQFFTLVHIDPREGFHISCG